MMEELWSMCH